MGIYYLYYICIKVVGINYNQYDKSRKVGILM